METSSVMKIAPPGTSNDCLISNGMTSYEYVSQNFSKLSNSCYLVYNGDKLKSRQWMELLKHFEVPELLSTEMYIDHNGYFGCRPTYDEKNGNKLKKYSTWFRCLVKRLLTKNDPKPKSGKDYTWSEMAFYTLWEAPGRQITLCVDIPEDFEFGLRRALEKKPLDRRDPFAMHIPLIDQITILNDDCVWRVRDPVRKIEKIREKDGLAIDFEGLHEISRHAIHVSEVLSATTETFENILRQQECVFKRKDIFKPLGRTYCDQSLEYLRFQVHVIKSLKLRSNSNYERLKSEITVAYNTIAQQDNTVMKSIALLTMVFLPATFISAFFSTTFFVFDDDGIWKVSRDIWIYCVVTVPSTALSILIWRLWVNGKLKPWLGKSKGYFDLHRAGTMKPNGKGDLEKANAA